MENLSKKANMIEEKKDEENNEDQEFLFTEDSEEMNKI